MGGVDCHGCVREALATVSEGACGVGGGFAQSGRPWIRVYSDRIGAFSASNFGYKSLLGALDSRWRAREFCTSLIEEDHKSDENGRDGDRKLRREKEQEEIVSRFESLLPKWSSNTPLLLNALQVNSNSIFVCGIFLHIFVAACIRGAGFTSAY